MDVSSHASPNPPSRRMSIFFVLLLERLLQLGLHRVFAVISEVVRICGLRPGSNTLRNGHVRATLPRQIRTKVKVIMRVCDPPSSVARVSLGSAHGWGAGLLLLRYLKLSIVINILRKHMQLILEVFDIHRNLVFVVILFQIFYRFLFFNNFGLLFVLLGEHLLILTVDLIFLRVEVIVDRIGFFEEIR